MSLASTHRVSWKHYFGAAVASYLSPWLGAYFGYVLFHMFLGFPPSWLLPADTIPGFFIFIPIPSFVAFYAVLIPDANLGFFGHADSGGNQLSYSFAISLFTKPAIVGLFFYLCRLGFSGLVYPILHEMMTNCPFRPDAVPDIQKAGSNFLSRS